MRFEVEENARKFDEELKEVADRFDRGFSGKSEQAVVEKLEIEEAPPSQEGSAEIM